MEGVITEARKDACFKIGNGSSINPWTDLWIPYLPDGIPKEKEDSVNGIRRVWELKDQEIGEWNLILLKNCFTEDSVKAILNLAWPKVSCENRILCKGNMGEAFSVSSSYSLNFVGERGLDNKWKKLWWLKMFIWRLMVGMVPTRIVIAERIDGVETSCVLYNDHEETYIHLFKQCPFIRALAFASKWEFILKNWTTNDFS